MNRPYIICHMVTSIDGKVTGDFLFQPECAGATDIYYRLNRELKADGFICGRVTMEGSFTGGWYPDLSQYEPVRHGIGLKMDCIVDDLNGFYAIAFDTHGKLGWKSNKIIDPDGDPGYDGAQIIEVLSEDVDERYLGYLESMEIPYIFAGEKSIDVELALFKLKRTSSVATPCFWKVVALSTAHLKERVRWMSSALSLLPRWQTRTANRCLWMRTLRILSWSKWKMKTGILF